MSKGVVIIEHPKCGRFWLNNILLDLDGVTPIMSHADTAGTRRTNKPPLDPRDFYDSLNPGVYGQKKKVFLYRDPRDVMVSFYYWVKYRMRKNVHKPSARNMSVFLRSKYGIKYLLMFYQLWAEYEDKYGMMFLSYEDMHKDISSCIKEVLEFLEVPVNEKQLSKAIERNSFKNMRKRELKKRGASHNQSLHARSGKVGDHVNHMSMKDIAYCNEMMINHPSKLIERYM